jgi:hypothetical protein
VTIGHCRERGQPKWKEVPRKFSRNCSTSSTHCQVRSNRTGALTTYQVCSKSDGQMAVEPKLARPRCFLAVKTAKDKSVCRE